MQSQLTYVNIARFVCLLNFKIAAHRAYRQYRSNFLDGLFFQNEFIVVKISRKPSFGIQSSVQIALIPIAYKIS